MTDTRSAPGPRLLADIGGTNARFALQAHADAEIEAAHTLAGAGHATLADAIHTYLQMVGATGAAAPRCCSIAIANPVLGDEVAMTNHHWTFSIAALKAQLGLDELLVVNDFTALALALPALRDDEKRQIGGGTPWAEAAIGLIGPGTGLGVSGLVPDGQGGWLPLQGEGGHVTLAGTTPRERAVLEHIAATQGHASAERVVSGLGLVNVHRALMALDGLAHADPAAPPAGPSPGPSAAEITSAALQGTDARCRETLELFCAYLGIAAGNLALTLGAKGGLYIGGGIVPRLGGWFAQSAFRDRFEAKGRFKAYLADIPVYVIDAHRSPALLGAACALASRAHFAGRAR